MIPGVRMSKRWVVQVRGRDSRTAARRAAMVTGAPREGRGWNRATVECATRGKVPMDISPEESAKQVHREAAGKKYIQQLRAKYRKSNGGCSGTRALVVRATNV